MTEDLELMSKSQHVGTHSKGEGNSRAKLTKEDVREIRHRNNNGESAASISEDYSVATSNIRRAISGKQWSDV